MITANKAWEGVEKMNWLDMSRPNSPCVTTRSISKFVWVDPPYSMVRRSVSADIVKEIGAFSGEIQKMSRERYHQVALTK